MQVSATALQTSLEQMVATIGLVVLTVILAIALLFGGIGSLPLTASAVETVLHDQEGNDGGPISYYRRGSHFTRCILQGLGADRNEHILREYPV